MDRLNFFMSACPILRDLMFSQQFWWRLNVKLPTFCRTVVPSSSGSSSYGLWPWRWMHCNHLKDCSAFIFRVKQLRTLTLKMNALQSFETLVTLFQLTCITYQKISVFGAPFCLWLRFWMSWQFLSLSVLHMRTVVTLLELSLSCSYSFVLFGGLLPQIWKLCKIVFNTFFTCRRSTNTFTITNITAIYKCLFQMRNDHLLGGSLPY